VQRVIVIATPQRRGYMAAFSISQRIGPLVLLPLSVAQVSAHIDSVDAELIVHSAHSTQVLPATIAEMQHILLLHREMSVSASPGSAAILPSSQ
jgi:hypothetical protein